MNTSTSNFENLMSQYATERNFTWDSRSEAYGIARMKFGFYSESYQQVMPYGFFLNNIINDKNYQK